MIRLPPRPPSSAAPDAVSYCKEPEGDGRSRPALYHLLPVEARPESRTPGRVLPACAPSASASISCRQRSAERHLAPLRSPITRLWHYDELMAEFAAEARHYHTRANICSRYFDFVVSPISAAAALSRPVTAYFLTLPALFIY